MKVLIRVCLLLVLSGLSLHLTGCSLMPHALQPDQLHKLSRQEKRRGDMYFSVPDEIPALKYQSASATEE
jgi:starvation-inducible outer membrane lipoprotein